jgi:hypothetical protein
MVARPKRLVAPALDPGAIDGAKAAGPFGFIEPSHPTLVAEAPSGPIGCMRSSKTAPGPGACARGRGHDLHAARLRLDGPVRSIADALARLPARDAVLDGELVVPGGSGLSDFGALEEDLGAGRSERFVAPASSTSSTSTASICVARPSLRESKRCGSCWKARQRHVTWPTASSSRRTDQLSSRIESHCRPWAS